MDDNLRGGV